MLRTLVIFVHPALEKSRAHRIMLQRWQGRDDLTWHDLYEEYPDLQIDAEREKRLLEEHDLIVFAHPLYWYSSPAILKKWQDVVLEYGYAYGHKGKALAGKFWLSAISCGGPEEAYGPEGYNHYTLREFLRPFEQTARLCHMTFLPPHVIAGVNRLSTEQLTEAIERLERRINLIRQDPKAIASVLSLTYLSELNLSPQES